MDKERLTEIMKKLDEYYEDYFDLEEQYGDDFYDSEDFQRLMDKVEELHLGNIKMEYVPKEDFEGIKSFVVLDPEFEDPTVFVLPKNKDLYDKTKETIYKIFTLYEQGAPFYDAVGIDLKTLIAIVAQKEDLPIISIDWNAELNNRKQWNAFPYYGGLTDMFPKQEETTHHM